MALGRRFAGIFAAVVLLSSVASIPFHASPFGGGSAFDSFIDAITGKNIQAFADDGPGQGKGKKFKVDESGTPFQNGLKKGVENRGNQGKAHPHATFEDPEIFQNDTKIIIKGKSKLKFDNPGQAGKDKWDDYIIENDNATNGNVDKFGTIKPGNYNDLVIEKINEKVMQKAKELENETGDHVEFKHLFKNDDDGDGMTDEDPVNGANDDNDCVDSSGDIFRDDGCFEEGELKDGMTELVDEDPVGQFEFGFEKRQLQIEETYDLTFEDEETATQAFALIVSDEDPIMAASALMGLTEKSSKHKVLMGFTFAPPAIDWTIGTVQEVCIDLLFDEFCFTAFEARAGFFLEYGLGLRLPAEVTIVTVETMVEEHPYHVSTSLQPLDFSAVDYNAMGVAPFGGNEFAAFLEFFLGVKVVIVEVTVIDWALDTDIDLAEMCTEFTHESSTLEDVDCGNFVTPFGIDPVSGEQREFPVPAVTLPADKTGLKMSFAGATLGIGLKVDPTFGSGSITADWSATGDASGSGGIEYTKSADNDAAVVQFGPIQAANFSPGTDNAEIRLDDFSYHLDTMQITLSANIDLGGWLSFVPDLPFFELITIDLSSLGFPNLSFGQHSGTSGALHEVFVEHYGIDVEVAPESMDIEPGFFGNYTMTVKNTGNVDDTFDTFAVSGLPGTWENSFESGMVVLSPSQSTSFEVGIKPFRHYTTSPGDYAFTVSGASEGAKVHDLVRTDSDSDIVHVTPFFEPHLSISPLHEQVLPGGTGNYLIMVENFGNAPDNISLDIALLDFGDTFRAVPTAIQPDWTTLGATEFGPIDPGQNDTTTFTATVPGTWEGMENTNYNFTGTATSETDPDATVSDTAGLGVTATKESMARYIDLEIRWLIEDVEASPVSEELKLDLLEQLLSAEQKKEQGLGHIIDGKFKQANNMLGATENMIGGFVSHAEAQDGKGVAEALADDWIARGTLIMQDLQTAIAQTF